MTELSILIAHVPSLRAALLSRLMARLEPQLRPEVEVIVHRSETKTMAAKFNELYKAANGRLSVQVDDDDLVVENYVDEILAVSPGHDFVGHRVLVTVDGDYQHGVVYTIDPSRAPHVPYSASIKIRNVTPKCPVLTAKAVQARFGGSFDADYRWVADLIQDGFPTMAPYSMTFIDKVLYHYDYWTKHTLGVRQETWQSQRTVPTEDYDPGRATWIE